MNKIARTILLGIFLFLIQVVILKRIPLAIGEIGFIHLIIYPLFILLFPVNFSRYTLLLLAFLYGLGIDIFYDSLGIHAGALVLMAYCRSFILKILSPYEGYKIEDVPTINSFGFLWFASYSIILLFIHLAFYFGLESFSLVYLFEITINTMLSLIASALLVFVFMFIVRPK